MSKSLFKKSPLQWAADLERICKGNSPLLGWAASLVYARYFGNTTRTNMERQFCPLRRQMELYRPDHQLTDEDLKPVLIAAGCDPRFVQQQCRKKVTNYISTVRSHGSRGSERMKMRAGVHERPQFAPKNHGREFGHETFIARHGRAK